MLKFRYVIQRCRRARVYANGKDQGQIEHGLVVLFGVGQGELALPPMPSLALQQELVESMQTSMLRCTEKIIGLRVFADESGKMNKSVVEVKGRLAFISQFTLFADCRNGFRPSFGKAAPAAVAEELFGQQKKLFEDRFPSELAPVCGIFASEMEIEFVNQGPVTVILNADSKGILGDSNTPPSSLV
jgi:D-aminoacyl-tRNA deacylase